ncbi:MAG TPA: endonuclease [Desulfobulbaceae bacterium]|nr:endonuclease [Desulfobulbaceae bacterium]
MRFLLYNIRYCAGIGIRFHLPVPYAGYLKRSTKVLDEIIRFIKEFSPDIIGLVEVDSGSFRTRHLCQAGQIASQLGHYHVVQSKYGVQSVAGKVPLLNRQGNAVLSRLPIVEHRFHYFEQGIKRLVIEARMEPLTVFLVHLSLTYRNRQYQLERLYRLISEVEGPVILTGDFNVLWGDKELDLFLGATGLINANIKGCPSHPSRSPKRQLDFILHSPDIRVTDFKIPGVLYSDHAPLVCDFELSSE